MNKPIRINPRSFLYRYLYVKDLSVKVTPTLYRLGRFHETKVGQGLGTESVSRVVVPDSL